jgi:hypothetical protein
VLVFGSMNRNGNNKRITKRRKGRKPRRNNGGVVAAFPRQLSSNPIFTRTLRYTAGTHTSDVTGRCLLNLLLAGISTSAIGINVVESIRLVALKIYGSPISSDNFVTNYLIWKGERSPDVVMVSEGTPSKPSFIKSLPPPGSLSSFWVSNLDTDIDGVHFSLGLETQSIIDVTVQFTLANGVSRDCTLSGFAPSDGLFYAPLDNAVAAGTVGPQNILIEFPLTRVLIATP